MERNVGRIMHEAEHLNELIAALMELSEHPSPTLAPGDPDQLLTDVVAARRGALESKSLVVEHLSAEPRAVCDFDRDQLRNAIARLLDNAIDAAPEGSDIRIQSRVSQANAWTCSIRNDGAVTPEQLRRAFEPFHSGRSAHAGVGLTLARRVIAAHSGTIELKADEKGVEATLSLPVAM
jgi:signal transduction histidine kinase